MFRGQKQRWGGFARRGPPLLLAKELIMELITVKVKYELIMVKVKQELIMVTGMQVNLLWPLQQ